MKKTITIILLSVAVLGAAGWMVWQQQTIKAAEEKHQQESKTNDEQLSKLTSVQADMKHENEDQKKKLSTITKKLKNEKKAYQKEVKQRKALEAKIDQLQKELTAAKATAQANKQSAQAARQPTVKKDPNVTHNPPSQWVQDQYDWGVKQGYIKE
ncbi:hypothetical protein ACQKIG_03310 [Bacillus safensis]|uniref:hypothetical protein n=1 Tax=Bacillus TaxID=1386 RepID=UPI00163CEEB7|nr:MULTISPECIES: hypothetical protein [Bacillus]MDI0191750.1 hypothetical protein [Bacillus safensis]QNH47016.1 hypothetical protein H7F25_14370 [Bacillus sp. PAMC28571]QNK44873.1 hypothetical protein H7F24_01695 [Bacillus sp. PAMC22265]QWS49983.1 hypothetical protein JNUCC24_16135 [Bacillus sp. JNUCC-24]WLW68976.1 hypothetical protein RA177_15690 [Bacillus safensis]